MADAAQDMYAAYAEEEAAPPPVVKKKKKMTKEEKLARRLKAEEDFKKLELREELKREYEMSKKTAKKYKEHWESLCREIKLKEMRDELEAWEIKVNRMLLQKDEKIQLIFDEIATTEEFHRLNFTTQLQMMDYLMDTYKAFQETLYLLYAQEASEILHDFYREVEENNEFGNSLKMNCECVAHATDLVTEQEMLDDYKIFLDKRDDRVNTEIEKRYRVRDAITKKMKELHKQLTEFLDSLLNVSLDVHKYTKVNLLMDRQRNFYIESKKLNATESYDSKLYSNMQRDLMQMEAECKRKSHDLKLEHAYFLQMRKNIENEMKLDRENTYEKLRIVASESFDVIKKYKKLLKQGELLLSLAANCRKFQTESEKVVPWGDFREPIDRNEDDNVPFQMEVINLKDHVDMTEAEVQTSIRLLKNFWRRQALAEAQIVLLEEQRLKLQQENQHYVDTIRRLSKADNVEDLNETLKVTSVLDKDTIMQN